MLRKINHTVSKHLTAFSVFLLIGLGVFAQDITVKGKVTDKSTGSGLASATILSEEDMKGTLSDENGNFELVLPRKATLKIRVTYIGYDTSFVTIQTQAGKSSYTENIELMEEGVMGEEVVITAGRHEQKLADVPVSMDVIKPMAIDVQATSNIEDVLQQSPGVDIMDGQPNIRGSSGFAYGVGSRVLLMMDGLPLLSGESGTAMFDVIPVDNITQIEIMKGAASVLYGSSAMGGVINVITGDAPDKPKTSVRLRGTVFDMPSNKRLDWDGPYSSPYIASLNVFHSRRIKGQDLTILLDGTKDSGYRESTDRTQFRAVVMTKFRPKKVPGLTLGVNSSFKRDTSGAFLYWDSYEPGYYPSNSNPLDSVYSKGAYSGSGSARRQLLYRVTADPFVKYLTPKGNMHNYRGRVLWTKNINDTQQGSTSNMIFNDYQYSTKIWKKRLSWVSGASFIYNNTVAPDLFGNITDTTLADTIPIDDGKHFSLNGAIYSQLDASFFNDRLHVTVGGRYELIIFDQGCTPEKTISDKMQIRHSPIARVGVNARTWPGNNVRASFGQAFRGPSIAERYTSTVGGGLVIEPNPCLDVEKGWSAELAIRQGFKTGTEKRGIFGYVDIAGFLMRYNSMIEFGVSGTTSNNPLDPGFGPVFSALNISNTRIWGFEVTGLIDARYDDFYVSLSGGVTWLDPRNVNPTPEDKQLNFHYQMTPLETFQELNAWLAPEGNPIKKYDNPSFLKYRNRLTTRATLVLNWRKITLTTNFQSKSRVVNYDQFFNVAIRGASEYWATRRVAYELVDMVLAYQVTKGLTASVNVDNIINREYMILPGIIGKQRNFTVQVKYVF